MFDSSIAPSDSWTYPWPQPEAVRDLVYARLLPVRQSIGQFLSAFAPESLVRGLVGATVSGFAPFLGGMARKTIGVGQLMEYTGVIYMATGGLVLYAILRHFERDHKLAEERSVQEL